MEFASCAKLNDKTEIPMITGSSTYLNNAIP